MDTETYVTLTTGDRVNTTIEADVAVVGARCGGAALGYLLARQGLRVVMLDRARFPSDTVSTHAIASAGLLMLREWGLLDAVVATGAPVRRTLGARVGEMEATFPVPDGRPGAMAPRRVVLDQVLIDAARNAGAELIEAATVRSVERDGSGRVIGLAARTATGTELTVRAQVTVGADGMNSRVRSEVGAEIYDVAPSWVSGVYAYYSDVEVEQNELAFGHRHCTLAFPTNGDLVCIAAVVHDESHRALVAGGDGAVVDVIAKASPRIAEAVARGRRETRFFTFRGQDNFRAVPAGPGWALLGDAGYYRDPITGQGIADAFVSAQLLADVLVEGLNGPCLDAEMSRYQVRRDELFAEAYAVACELSRYDWTDESLLMAILRYRAAVDATASAVERGLWKTEVLSSS